ncbi:DUF3093 domain-containing protein [Corynebacterium sp.]|uniref:DUF3093 domain-containing protein n=1 Tax=Corynebacterium sp. TaxID=1720 RepID=UPI0025B8E18A|nr:DUF3093 domain-containing protein [Corynebacterium sp.]
MSPHTGRLWSATLGGLHCVVVNVPDQTGDDVAPEPAQEPSGTSSHGSGPAVLYSERQPVPLSWWLIGIGVAALLAWQGQMKREWYWGAVVGVIALAAVIWSLVYASRNRVVVERDETGETWLRVGDAALPRSAVSRTVPVPPTARRAAMGRQLDPAAYVVHRTWIPAMAMFVLDDPDDPTPYWLVSTGEPEELLRVFGAPVS